MNFTPEDQVKSYLYLHDGIKITGRNADQFIADLEPMKANWPRRDFTDQGVLSSAYCTLAEAYFQKKNIDKAIDLMQDGIEEINQLSKHAYNVLSSMHRQLAHYYVYANQDNDALKNLRLHVFYLCISHTHYNVREFYSFRSVNEFSLKDLRDNTITLADPDTFNDVVDSLIQPWLYAQRQDLRTDLELKEANLLQEAWGYARIRCFAFNKPLPTNDNPMPKPYSDRAEYSNTLMWSHYTSIHKGFCVRYQFPSTLTHEDLVNKRVLVMGEVKYVENVPMDTETFDLQRAFFTKSKDWSYEHEKRLLYYDIDTTEKYHPVPVPENSITDVYFGVRCSDEDKKKIIDALKGKNVKYHRMVIDLNDIYRLLPKDFDPVTLKDIVITKAEKKEKLCKPQLNCIPKLIKAAFKCVNGDKKE